MRIYTSGPICESERAAIPHLGAICRECALAAGFVPKNKTVGVWPDVCGICHQYRPCTDLWHDWNPPKAKAKEGDAE